MMDRMFMPQRGVRSRAYLPADVELPAGLLKMVPFTFLAVGAFATVESAVTLTDDAVMWGLTGFSTDAAGFAAQVFHNHDQVQRQLFNKHLRGDEAFGSAQRPFLIRGSSYVFARGDSVTVEVKNLKNAVVTRIEVVLWMVEPT